MWHRTADGRHYNTEQQNYDELLDAGLSLLIGLSFKWSGITVTVGSSLVNQIIRRWGTLSLTPAVEKIRNRLSNYAFDNRRNRELHEIYTRLADSVGDVEFWKSVQERV